MGFLIGALASAGLTWALVLVMRGSVLLGCGFYLVTTAVFGPDFLDLEVGGLTLSLDRLVLLGVIGAYLAQRLMGRTVSKDCPTSERLLLGFTGILVLSTAFHGWQSPDPNQIPIFPHMVEGYLIPVLLYWIARQATITHREINWLYFFFGIFGIYLAITAVFESAGVWGLVYPKYIANPDLGIHFGRARGPFLQSVRLGIYLMIGLWCVWIPLVWQACWGRVGQLLGILCSTLLAAAMVLTLTRSVWLGFGLATLVLIGLTFYGSWRRGAIAGILLTSILGIALANQNLLSFRREYGPAETQQSTQMRLVFAYVTWLMVQEHPLEGVGFGRFPYKKDAYLNDRATGLQMETIRGFIHHNTFLSLLVELGVFAFVLYCALLVAWTRRALAVWRDWQAPAWMRGQGLLFVLLMVSHVIQMLFHEVSYTSLENGALFLMAGLMSRIATLRGVSGASRFHLHPELSPEVKNRSLPGLLSLPDPAR